MERLTTFHRAIVAARAAAGEGLGLADTGTDAVDLRDVTLDLPNGARLLRERRSDVPARRVGGGDGPVRLRQINAVPRHRRHLAVRRGPRGAAARGRCLFLPQRPYIPLGTLAPRRRLSRADPRISSKQAVAQALEDAGPARSRSASGRGRELGAAPLAAASSSGSPSPARCSPSPTGCSSTKRPRASTRSRRHSSIAALKQRLPGTTIVSIAHRPTVAQFHDHRLVFRREEGKPGQLVRAEPAPASA